MGHGLIFDEYRGNNPEMEIVLDSIARDWLANRMGPQAYLIALDVFAHRESKRWFYAHKDNEVVGFLMLSRLEACNGWILNGSIMFTPQAPNSVSEFLVLSVLDILRAEGSTCLSVGPTISTEIGRIEGFGWFSKKFINFTMKSVRTLFKMQDRQRYWKKFLPRKEPSFLTFTSARVGLQELRALLRTFNVNV